DRELPDRARSVISNRIAGTDLAQPTPHLTLPLRGSLPLRPRGAERVGVRWGVDCVRTRLAAAPLFLRFSKLRLEPLVFRERRVALALGALQARLGAHELATQQHQISVVCVLDAHERRGTVLERDRPPFRDNFKRRTSWRQHVRSARSKKSCANTSTDI